MLKPRKVTLSQIREVLKTAKAPMTDDELAQAVGCAKSTIRNAVAWVWIAAGVRCVRQGGKKWLGWRYVPPEECYPYEPATPTIEQLEARIVELQRENEVLRRSLPIDE